MSFSISGTTSAVTQELSNIIQNPTADTVVTLDPSYTGNSDGNVFTNWNDAYLAVRDKSGIRYIAFAPQETSTTNTTLFFAGASGTYDMTGIYLSQTTPRAISVAIAPGFTLLNLRGIFAERMTLVCTAMTQNFIEFGPEGGKTGDDMTLQNVSIAGALPAGVFFIRALGDATFTSFAISLVGNVSSSVNIVPLSVRGDTLDLLLLVPSAGAFWFGTSISCTGALQLFCARGELGLPSIKAGWPNVAGAVTYSNVSPVVQTSNRVPNVNDDGAGATNSYALGTLWIDTTTDATFICSNNSDGAAVWTQLTP